MSLESLSYHYQVRIEDVMENIEAGIFPKNSITKKDGRIFLNSVVT